MKMDVSYNNNNSNNSSSNFKISITYYLLILVVCTLLLNDNTRVLQPVYAVPIDVDNVKRDIKCAWTSSTKATTTTTPAKVRKTIASRPIPPFKTRVELGDILEVEKKRVGVELGVQQGNYTNLLLGRWKTSEEYVLVDIWRQQTNYEDLANLVTNTDQERYKGETIKKVEKFKINRNMTINICQDFTTNCAKRYSNEYFDFIYVDARHDYKGVLQDLTHWWPLLKHDGIMAGHDYVEQYDGPQGSGQNWTVNFDGSVDSTGRVVKGAVDDFFMKQLGLQISVGYRERAFNTWAVRKP